MKNKEYPNLSPWQPGQSGNPAGRKPGSKNMSTIVQELLNQDANNEILVNNNLAQLAGGVTTTYAKAVVFAAITKALQGNMQAIIWLAEHQERGAIVGGTLKQEPLIISTIKARKNLQ